MNLLSLYMSEYNNGPYSGLGGKPSFPISASDEDNTYRITIVFENEVMLGLSVYTVLYVKNNLFSPETVINEFAISVKPEITSQRGYIDELYLSHVKTSILIPEYITKNFIHPRITYDGFFLSTYPEHIEDYNKQETKKFDFLFTNETLFPGDFFPIILRVQTLFPIPTVFKLGMEFRIISGVL